ncbi:MAG TPA: choice-of-anchor D domain-containing protein [Steroidobacteraceae bacterium]|nr:choice-of-anchor D domain-containing protein [Steroidobacteraceae bacterium]
MLASLAGVAAAAPSETELISISTITGRPALGRVTEALRPISADGRYVAFEGWQDDIVPGDSNDVMDVFVRDRQNGTTERITLSFAGGNSNRGGQRPSISADGRYVSFISSATNLVPGDTNAGEDVFVRDRQTGVTERVSVSSSGAQGLGDFVRIGEQMISGNGRFVVFVSNAVNLVPDDTNGDYDLFVHDLELGTTERINVGPAGEQSDDWTVGYYATISDDGRFVAFRSKATNLVPGDPNPVGYDIYLRDLVTDRTVRLHGGFNWGPVISGNGRYVVFHIGQVYLLDRIAGTTEVVSVGAGNVEANAICYDLSISPDGRYVSFISSATNLVPGLDPTASRAHAYVRDRLLGRTELVTVNSRGVPLRGNSAYPWVSADGQVVVFQTKATNIVPDDTNAEDDVYVRQRGSAAAYPFTVKPKSLDFGATALGTRATLAFWVRNKGTRALPITSISLRGTDRAMFRLDNRCGATLAAGQGCGIRVTFAPTALGVKFARVRVVAGDGQIRNRPVSGTGVAPDG